MGINYCGQKTRIQLISRQGQNSQNASLNYQMDMYFETKNFSKMDMYFETEGVYVISKKLFMFWYIPIH